MVSIGVTLPTSGGRAGAGIPQPAELAKLAEDVGLGSLWCGDHLDNGEPLIDSTLTLTAAAAVTSRIELCFGILLVALRPAAVVTRQLATLQYLSGDRVVLGVGVGGKWPSEWRAAGASFEQRGARTDAVLRMLPDLLAGKETRIVTEPGEPTVTLAPAVGMPPIWVGGRSARAMRRTIEFGRGWIGSMATPDELRALGDRLGAMAAAAGRDTPEVGTIVFATADPGGAGSALDYFARTFNLDRDRGAQLIVAGGPEALAERVARYEEAGVTRVVFGSMGPDVRANYEAFGAAAALLRG